MVWKFSFEYFYHWVLLAAQQVIDFLRDKLHNLSTQLVESNEKVAELENQMKEDRSSLARSAGLLETTGRI